MSTLDNAFIDGYVWEVKQWPRAGEKFDFYQLNDIYYYNSLSSDLENKKQSVYIQIPELLIDGKENIEFVRNNLKEIIENNIPVVKRINDETWVCDLSLNKK